MMKMVILLLGVIFISVETQAQTLSVEKMDAFALRLMIQSGLSSDLDFEQPPRVTLLESFWVNELGEKIDLSGVALLYSFAGDSIFVSDYQYLMFYIPADGSSPAIWFAEVDNARYLTGYAIDQMSVFLDPSEGVNQEVEDLLADLQKNKVAFGQYQFFDAMGLLWFEGLYPDEGFSLYKYLAAEKSFEVSLAPFWTRQVFDMGPLVEVEGPLLCIDELREYTKGFVFAQPEVAPPFPGEEDLPTLLEILSVEEPCPLASAPVQP